MVQLSSLGMVWDIPQESWDESYRQLVEFHDRHGHTNVPIDSDDSFSLWVHNQRRAFKQLKAGEYSRITQERIDRLNELNFEWNYQEAVWMEKYHELCRYQQEHGNT
jgi:DNA-binding SARP family transcriptional activator